MTLAGPAADVIELASVPAVPEMGTPLQVGMMAMGVSLLFGCMIAVMLDRFDGRIRGAEEVEWQLNVPMLGVAGSSRALLAPARGGAAVESFRMIRNSIDFADHTLRSLCITAAGPREGTSATVANLAWTWAEQGARVLVIDTNLARPSQHQLLGAAGATGLAEHLAQQTPLDELVQPTTVTNVSLLAAGQLGQRKGQAVPALTPQALSALLLWARSRADIILFDTAPLLQTSDPAMIARQADGTILVARRQWTATRDLRRAVHLLSSGGEGLLGVVLTGTTASASWDPMPVDESEPETESASLSRSAVSRQRKRTRQAA
jgi:capsular exopolysaccharide synthesis family protein